jgi:hypothetical protein
MAVISAGVGAVVGMIAGFFLGGVADVAVSAATGHEHVHYAYLLAEGGMYVGLFVGIVVGIGTGDERRTAGRKVESASPPYVVEPMRRGGQRDRADDSSDIDGAAAA